MAAPLITLLTDFRADSGYPAQMKGVMLRICPDARFVDISHAVPPFQIMLGQLLLRDVAPCFGPGTIHLAVVDPGVGSSRRPIVVVGGDRAPGQLFVGPDNGLLWPFIPGGRVYELAEPAFRRNHVSSTFHGRDIFAPAAAHLAMGVAPERFGPEVHDPVKLVCPRARREGGAVVGEILYIDPFGNLITSLDVEDLPESSRMEVKVSVAGRTIAGVRGSYSDVAEGELVALFNSAGRLEVGIREGSAARELGLDDPKGMPVVVEPA